MLARSNRFADFSNMIIWPDCTLKTLKDCRSGAIVRPVGFSATGAFAIACDVKDSEKRALIYLEREGPEFQIASKPEEFKLLEYYEEAVLQVDQAGPFEGRPLNLYETNGCLLRSAYGWRLNVRQLQGFYHEGAQYDFASKMLERVRDDLSIGTFGKWQLVLVNPARPHDPPVEVGAFEWRSPSEEGA